MIRYFFAILIAFALGYLWRRESEPPLKNVVDDVDWLREFR